MGEITIALRAPVAGKRIQRWVEEHVESLREAAWSSGVRLGPLWPAWSGQAADWLLEVDLRDRQVDPEDDVVLQSVLMQIRMLGLRPHVLESPPQDPAASPDCDGAATSAAARPGS